MRIIQKVWYNQFRYIQHIQYEFLLCIPFLWLFNALLEIDKRGVFFLTDVGNFALVSPPNQQLGQLIMFLCWGLHIAAHFFYYQVLMFWLTLGFCTFVCTVYAYKCTLCVCVRVCVLSPDNTVMNTTAHGLLGSVCICDLLIVVLGNY